MPSVNLLNMENDIVTDRLNSSFRNCSDASNSIVDGLSSFRANSMNFNSFSNSLDVIGSSSNGSINYSAFVSPCQNSKLSFNLSNSSASHLIGSGDFRSLQNSPFYNHYPGNSSNLSEVDSPNNNNLYSQSTQNSTQKNFNSNQVNNIERILKNGGPQRELFTQQSLNSNGLRYQDRLYYYSIAQSQGYIVGLDLERIKENSRRSMSQTYGRISAYFRNRYGETEAKTKASYLQLGVRVPSKDHVSEIVGKGGQKIKLIREETGALITTPGENEEHVFIIEAPPEIALNVANHLTRRAQEITQSKLIAGDRRRGSAGSGTPGATSTQSSTQCFTHNLIGCPVCVTSNGNGISQSSMPNSPANNNGISINSNSNGSISMLTSRSSSNNLSSNGISNGAFNSNGGCSNGDHSNSSSPPLTSAANFNRNTTLTSGNGSSNTITNCVNNLNGSNGTNNNNSTITSSRILLARGRISVPQDMVGKIIGTQGSIITTIQKDTGTEIKSPPKEAGRGPDALADFEISAYQGLGLTSAQAAECRVQQAKQLIGHLVMRQLERRTSDDIDEVILTPGSERGTTTNGNSNGSNGHLPNTPNGNSMNGNACNGGQQPQNITWMWPDVAQMDSNEAREVLDRILAESKSKTRRVKEVCSVGNNSPNDCFQNPNGSSLNGTEVWIQNAVAAAAASNNNTNGSNNNLPGLCSSQLSNGQRFNDIPMHGLSHYQQMAKSSLPSSPLRSNGIDSNLIDPFSNHQLCMQSNNNSVLNRYYMQSPGAGNGNGLLDSDNEQKNSNFSSLEQGPANFLDNDFARLWNSMGISQTTMNNKNPTSGTSEGSDYCQTSGAGSVDENKSRTTNGNIGAIGDGRRRSTPPSSENNFGRTSNSTSTSSSRGESLGDHFNHQMYINSTNNTANSVLSKLFLQSPPVSGTGSNVQDFENSPNDYNDNNSCVLIQF